MLSLLLILSAAPVDVVVVDVDEQTAATRAALQKGLAGHTLVDATALFGHLHSAGGIFDFQDFSSFSAGPPSEGWPSTLDDTWKRSVGHCRRVIGPPPWKLDSATFPGARCCGQRLGRFLWEQYLADKKADQVYLVRSFGGDKVRVVGTRYGPRDADALEVSRDGLEADKARLVKEVLAELLAGTGVRSPRQRVPVLFTEVPADPWATSAAPGATPLSLPTCDALPAKLLIKPEGPTAKALGERWAASVKGKGAPLACSVSFSMHKELVDAASLPLGVSADDPVYTTVLECAGGVTASAELMKSPLLRKPPLDVVSARVLSALATQLCK